PPPTRWSSCNSADAPPGGRRPPSRPVRRGDRRTGPRPRARTGSTVSAPPPLSTPSRLPPPAPADPPRKPSVSGGIHVARADAPLNRAVPDPIDFWRERLDGVPPLELPADRPRPVVRATGTAVHTRELPAPAARALTELGRQHATSRTAVLA